MSGWPPGGEAYDIEPVAGRMPGYVILPGEQRTSSAPEFPATWAGGHALVIEFGDEVLTARCQCGEPFGTGTPATPLDSFSMAWENHVMTGTQEDSPPPADRTALRGTCRCCGRDSALKLNGMVVSHLNGGRPCDGTWQSPA